MLKGKSLVELAQAVQDTTTRKVDVVADTRSMKLSVEEGKPFIHAESADSSGYRQMDSAAMTDHALSQLTEHAGIPAKYAGRMLAEAPRLLELNANHWLQEKPSLRMVRTIRNDTGPATARAFLSNRYRRMENDQLLAAILPELIGAPGLQVVSTELTETRMYVKVVLAEMTGEVRKGDVVQYGYTVSNSEIGMGALDVSPFVYRLVCLNGLRVPKDVDDTRMRKAHLGRALEAGTDYYADETIMADDKALALMLRDTVRAFQNTDRWNAVLNRLRLAADSGDAADPIATVERIADLLVLPKPEHNAVLTNFLSGGDYSKWGLVNAVTAVANDATEYDRATELEIAGGKVLDLPATEWTRLAKAA